MLTIFEIPEHISDLYAESKSVADFFFTLYQTPDALYEMISGEAIVTVQNTEVGRIIRGEIFGEISFLTQSTPDGIGKNPHPLHYTGNQR